MAKMVQIIYAFVSFATITSGTCSILTRPFYSKWLHSPEIEYDSTEIWIDEPTTEQQELERSLCTTKQCKILGKTLKENMNEAVHPCYDFYKYACGNWEKHNPLPPGENRWNLLVKSQRNVEKRMKEILEGEPQPDDLYSVRFAKRAYNICMDTDAMDKAGLQPLISTLWRTGGWPLIMEEEEWDEEIYKWQTIDDYYAYITGSNAFYDLHVGQYIHSVEDDTLIMLTPHFPPNVYSLISEEEIDLDSSDENNDSGEGSQERGSEEKQKSDSGEGSQELGSEEKRESNEEDSEDDDKDQELLAYLAELLRNATRNKKIPKTEPRGEISHQVGSKTKRSLIEGDKHVRDSRKVNKLSNVGRERKTQSTKPFTMDRKSKNNEKNEKTNSDLYFDDSDDNEYESISSGEDQSDISVNSSNDDEEGDQSSGDYNDSKTDDEENGSGNGDNDDNKTDDEENSSGSGDTDDSGSGEESGSGSGDYDDSEGDDENDSGSGDKSDDDSSSDEEDKEAMEKRKKAEEARNKYAEYILNVSMALAEARGVLISEQKLKKDIADLVKFQVDLLKVSFMYGGMLNTTLQLFQKKYDCLVPQTSKGKINWIGKLQSIFASGGIETDETMSIVISSFRYIKKLQKLLDNTPSKTIVNYVHWNFIGRVIKDTTHQMRDWYYDWSDKKVPVNKRSAQCIKEIGASYSLGYEYVRKYFPDEILQTASDMVDDIQKEVEYQIKESTWMDSDTKHFILDKLVYMQKLIGYPSTYRNNTIMKQHLKGLSISRSHYDNTLNVMRYLKWNKLKSLFLKNSNPEELETDPLMVNAFFIAFYNAIEITAADFQSPLFDYHQPWYTNFGAIGMIMAHEVNHGFDYTGRFFDKYGNYMDWLPAMAQAYEKRAECFENQFTKYSVEHNKTANLKIENYGERTKEENIADSMGLQAVFRAYQRRQRACKNPDPMLPGLEDFTNEQLFFLSFASLWCEVADPEELESQARRDSHSMAALRLIGSVSNSDDFAEAFKCEVGSPMNPKKKCSLWK